MLLLILQTHKYAYLAIDALIVCVGIIMDND